MDEHVWIPAILVNKRVPWSAHGQPMVSPPCVSGARWGRRTHLRVPSRSGRGISFRTGAQLGLGPLGFLDPWETAFIRCPWVGYGAPYVLKTTAAELLLGSQLDHLGYLGRQRLRMKERRGCDGRGQLSQPPHWILRVKFWDGAWSSTVLRAKSSMTFCENRERLNPLVNHDYLWLSHILSAFQWP